MIGRALIRGATLLGILAATGGASARTETAPQQFKPGAVVKLRALEIELKLPDGAEAWTVSLAVEGTDAWDLLRRIDPARGDLSIELSRSHAKDCPAVASVLAAQKAKVIASSPLAPSAFEPWAYQLSGTTYRLCTNTFRGPVTADVSGSSLDPAEVAPLLAEVAKMVSGQRGVEGLTAKGMSVSIVGKIMLPGSGVYADIPKTWRVHVVTDKGGSKIDVIERTEPPEPVLRVTIERRAGECATAMPEGKSVLDASYLPKGFGPASIESRDKELRTATFCMSAGSDAILASVTYAGELTHPDVAVVKSILAPAAGGSSPVGSSVSSDADVDEREDEMQLGNRIRGVAALDLHYFTASAEPKSPLGAGLSLEAYSSTARHGLGFAVEVGARGGVGIDKFLTWDAGGGVGGALTFGKFIALLTVGGGGDGFHGVRAKDATATAFEAPAAGYGYGALRFVVPLARKVSLDLRGAYVHRFDDTVNRELRGHLGASFGAMWLGARMTSYSSATLATLVLGFAF